MTSHIMSLMCHFDNILTLLDVLLTWYNNCAHIIIIHVK